MLGGSIGAASVLQSAADSSGRARNGARARRRRPGAVVGQRPTDVRRRADPSAVMSEGRRGFSGSARDLAPPGFALTSGGESPSLRPPPRLDRLSLTPPVVRPTPLPGTEAACEITSRMPASVLYTGHQTYWRSLREEAISCPHPTESAPT